MPKGARARTGAGLAGPRGKISFLLLRASRRASASRSLHIHFYHQPNLLSACDGVCLTCFVHVAFQHRRWASPSACQRPSTHTTPTRTRLTATPRLCLWVWLLLPLLSPLLEPFLAHR
jgi:hypothetical protein